MKKAIIITTAVIVLIAVGAASTIAWLTATSSTLVNTFTVGKVDITLTEPAWTSGQNDNILVPGKAITKDPTVTVLAGSEKCYVFVKIKTTPDLDAVIDYEIDTDWTALGASYPGVYYQVVDKPATDTALTVLANNQVTIPTVVTKTGLEAVQTAADTMNITAYAIQYNYLSDGSAPVNDAEGAWNILT